MKSRRRILGILSGSLGITLLPSMKSRSQTVTTGNFYHVVYFWLKSPDNKDNKNKFLASLNGFLDEVDVIISRHVGQPAGTRREVIDSSYTFSLVLSFKNRADQDLYQEHPSHKRFIAESADLWERVQVFDSTKI